MSQNLPKIKLFNRSILLDVSHVAKVGDDKIINGFVVGKHEHSEIPTYGVVVAVADDIKDEVEVGSNLSIPTPGLLRTVDWAGKDQKLRLVTLRLDQIDLIVKQ